MPPVALFGLSPWKWSLVMALGSGTILSTEIGDPAIERYVSLGIGGVLALTIFWFYRQQSEEFVRSHQEMSKAYKEQAEKLLTIVQESSHTKAQLAAALTEISATVTEVNKEQRDRYERELLDRDGGRRMYDPSRIPKG